MVVEGLLGQGKPQLVTCAGCIAVNAGTYLMLNFKLVFLLEGYVTSHARYGYGSSYLCTYYYHI